MFITSGVRKGERTLGKCILTNSVTDFRAGRGSFWFSEKTEALKRSIGAGCPEISRTLFKKIRSRLHKIGFTPLSLYAYCFSKGRTLSGISTRC